MSTPYITSNPNIMFGKPVVAGTRVTVEIILDRFAAGENEDDLLANFPRLTREGIRAALAYASKSLGLEEVYPVEESQA